MRIPWTTKIFGRLSLSTNEGGEEAKASEEQKSDSLTYFFFRLFLDNSDYNTVIFWLLQLDNGDRQLTFWCLQCNLIHQASRS